MVDNQYETPIVNEFFTNRHYYFIPFLIFHVVLALFADFVILTKSKTLGVFKFYILNQTIWIQLFEIAIILLNPIFLNPYMAGFMAGVFRNIAGYSTTSITNAIVFFLLESVIIGVVLTYLNRYILTFHPEYQHYVDNQYTGWFLIGFHSIMGCLNIFFYFLASTDAENARTLASSESHHALDVYLTEPTFIYASELNGAARGLCKFGLFLLIIISFMFLGSVGFFIRNVFIYKKMKGVVSKMSQFLLNSTFIQVVLLVTFIFVPFIWATFTWSFTIHNIVNVTNGFVMLISMYGPIDMLCTLYFIVPYRRYCESLIFCGNKQPTGVFIVARPSRSTNLMTSEHA